MKEDSVNNGKVGVKKVSGTSRRDGQGRPLGVPDEVWEQVKKDPRFQELVRYLTRKDSREKELKIGKEAFLGQKQGRPRKDSVFFMQKLLRLVECVDDELFFWYRDMLFENLRDRMRKIEKFSEDELKNALKEWVKETIDFLLAEECEVEIDINELKNELLNEIERMDKKTLNENFYKLIVETDPTRELEHLKGKKKFEVLSKAGEIRGRLGLNREKGEIAEVIVYSQLRKICENERLEYLIIPYFEKDKPQEKKKKGKQGRKKEGHYYADIAVIDMDNKVAGIIELKNWMSRGVYEWDDYKKHDRNKWKKTEKDVRKVLKWISGGRVKESSPGITILKKDEFLLKAVKEGEITTEDTIKEGVNWKLLHSIAMDVSKDSGEIDEDIKWILFELSKPIHLHREIRKHPEIKPEEFRIVKFWVMFRGKLDEGNENKVEGMRLLNKEIRKDFVNKGVIEVQVWPALFIDKIESWEVGRFIARAILEIMRTGSITESNWDEHTTIDEDDEHGDVRIIKIRWKTLPYKCTIRIPKTLRWET